MACAERTDRKTHSRQGRGAAADRQLKFRGAYNRISRIVRDEYPGGVVACSSGNHAQGVAEAARLCGLKALIVMPSDAPRNQGGADPARRRGGGFL